MTTDDSAGWADEAEWSYEVDAIRAMLGKLETARQLIRSFRVELSAHSGIEIDLNPDIGLAYKWAEEAHEKLHHASERLELHLQRGGNG